MISSWMLIKIGTYVMSILGGYAYYFFLHPLSGEIKKHQLNEFTSLVINFILFIWVSKVLLHISTFINDPLAVIAYPVHTSAIYLGAFLLWVNLLYRKRKSGEQIKDTVFIMVPVFMSASFIYEFIEVVIRKNTYSWLYLLLLAALVFSYLIFIGRVKELWLIVSVSLGWIVGQLIFYFMGHSIFFFNYQISSWSLAILLLVTVGSIIFEQKNYRN